MPAQVKTELEQVLQSQMKIDAKEPFVCCFGVFDVEEGMPLLQAG